jgi:hypothetical protein
MRLSSAIAGLSALVGFLAVEAADAQPARIILMRHAEKKNAFELCDLGRERALALSQQYLGKGAQPTLFPPGPDAFFAVTLHPVETATPSAQTWALPVIDYSVVPKEGAADDSDAELDVRTQQAANDLLHSPAYEGKTVVVVWEHKHIASKKLDTAFYKLLNLDKLPKSDNVPNTWSGTNYDYFWIVDHAAGSDTPTNFRIEKQSFSGKFSDIPDNDWDTPEPKHEAAGCKK